MNPQESYPAGQVEPDWQIFIDDQWRVAGVVIETETTDGTHYITIVFKDAKLPAVRLRKSAVIPARPPGQQPAVEPGN